MKKWALLIAVSVWLMACTPVASKRTCEEIAAKSLRALLERPAAGEDLRGRVAEAYALAPDQVALDQTGLSWVKNDVYGEIAIRGSSPVSASLDYRAGAPTADQVAGCLGEPETYRAYYSFSPGMGEHTLSFEMYFPQQGILSMVQQRRIGSQPPKVTGSIEMVYFLFISPDSTEATMNRLTAGLAAELRQQIKPWPGKWEDLIVEVDPSIKQ